MSNETHFPSRFAIGDDVRFLEGGGWDDNGDIIERVDRYGTITAVKFTKAKVFYDILDDYSGRIFPEIDSTYVYEYKSETL
jgi:hypothetical protein